MVTLKDIAEKSNLSVTTVSRVVNFNDTSICNEESQKLIWSLVESMNYKVKNKKPKLSKDDETQPAYKLAYVLGQSSYAAQGSYGYHIIKGIESETVKSGASIAFNCLNLDLYKPEKLCERLQESGVHAVIWVAGTEEDYLSMLKSKNIQVTVAGIEPSYLPEYIDYVGVDFYPETLKWLKTKFVNQFEQTGYIGPTYSSRYEAFVDANKILDKKVDPAFVIAHDEWDAGAAKTAMSAFLERTDRLPEAFFAASDTIAIGAMNALRDRGIKVPEQVKFLGFDNNEMAAYLTPGLTTIGVPTFDIGVMAVQAAISQLRENRGFPVRFILPTRFIERKTL